MGILRLARNPFLWVYLVVVVLSSAHIIATRNGCNGIDFYNFWLVPQIMRDLGTTDIYAPEKQAEFGTYYFKKYYDSSEPIGEKTSYGPDQGVSLPQLREYYMSSPDRFFNFTNPLKEQTDLQIVSGFRRLFPDLTGTPFLYTTLSLFESGNFSHDYKLFQVVSLVSVIGAMLIFAYILGFSVNAALAISFIFLFHFYPIRHDAINGNTVNLQLGLLALFILFYSLRQTWTYWAAGSVLALSVFLKPTTLFVIPVLIAFWVGRRLWKTTGHLLLGFLAGSAFAISISSYYFGTLTIWERWFSLIFLKISNRNFYLSEMTNYSPVQLIMEYTHWNSLAISLVILCLVFGFLLYCSLPILKKKNISPPAETLCVLALMALGSAAMLLSSGLVWHFYEILYVPLFFFILSARGLGGSTKSSPVFFFILLVVFTVMGLDGLDWRTRNASGLELATANVLSAFVLVFIGGLSFRTIDLRGSVQREGEYGP